MQNFSELYQQYYSSVFSLSGKILNNRDDTADITQEVFIKLYQEINNNNIILYPKTWLYKVTVNKAINHLNRKKEFVQLEENDNLKKGADDCILDEIDQSTRSNILNNALDKLKPTEKVVIILYSDGLSYKEIAEVSGINLNTVGKLISRTFEKLKIILKDNKDELFD
ncbi:MAG: hypothetical protein H6Q19_2095 [Bacteroidetes bacterium]|nr:hypothetical protein [Bacteroidota bacterium]